MAKPPPGDRTQPLSESQVVAVTPKPPTPGAKPIAPNDQSVAWKGTVVSPDEFSLPTAPRHGSGAKWIVLGVLGAGAVGAGTYTLWPAGQKAVMAGAATGSARSPGSGAGSATGSATGAGTGSAAATGAAAAAGSGSGSGAVAASVPGDAGVPAAAPTPDAISGAQVAATKPKVEKPVRHVVRKKHVTRKKRRR